jgi:hypothetical protein
MVEQVRGDGDENAPGGFLSGAEWRVLAGAEMVNTRPFQALGLN